MMRGWHRALPLLCACTLGGALAEAVPGAQAHQLTAAYLYNFARFIEWSPAPDPERARAAEFLICVEGSDAVRQALAPISGQPVAGRPVAVRAARADRPDCRIGFVSRDALHGGPVVAPAGVLTVSDAPDFIERGGIIALVLRDGRLRFRVNREAAHSAGLRVPPQILALAVE